MKSNIVFFDTYENSRIGTLRGLVIFPIFIILTLIWIYVMKKSNVKSYENIGSVRLCFYLIFSGLLIVSAIGVHNPDSYQKAAAYALLVGFVVYSISNMYITNDRFSLISLVDIIVGITITTILGIILYWIVEIWPCIFKFK